MLQRFKKLIDTYASKEITLEDLQTIQNEGFLSFDNTGISRSKKDCLLCIVTYDKLLEFKNRLHAKTFNTYSEYEEFILTSEFNFTKDEDTTVGYVCFRDTEKMCEICLTIDKNGKIEFEREDIEINPSFNVYLRIQNF